MGGMAYRRKTSFASDRDRLSSNLIYGLPCCVAWTRSTPFGFDSRAYGRSEWRMLATSDAAQRSVHEDLLIPVAYHPRLL